MPAGDGTETSESSFVPSNLTQLVPSFDPSIDDVETWSKKVELLARVWPKEKLAELNTRLILNTKGSAFQKLQIQQDELLKNDIKCVEKLVQLVGGQFGQIPLERRYEFAERALFRCVQKSDESNDSYLARADVAWTEVISRGVKLEELQAYVVLRGSLLNADDKKRVLVEAGAETGSQLTMAKVSAAVRMLGAGFFQEYTGGKKAKLKTYDQSAFMTEEVDATTQETFVAQDDEGEEDYLEALLMDGDEDAILISEYETAINDTIQDDSELATALNAYADARRRLSERFRNGGFWPVRSYGKGTGKGKGGQKGKGKGGRRSLQDRILSSRCRICNKLGHWKAECPDRKSQSSSSGGPTASIAMSESVQSQIYGQTTGDTEDALMLEFLKLPESITETPLDEPKPQCNQILLSVHEAILGIRNRVTREPYSKDSMGRASQLDKSARSEASTVLPLSNMFEKPPQPTETANSADVCFASHGSYGVVDLGASKTVIGSSQVGDLMKSLPEEVRKKLSRSPCKMQFRFGNQGILSSEHALVIPMGDFHVKIAVVPGNTPFLISNSFLRGIQATIDTHHHTLCSPHMTGVVPLHLSPRGLFLVDLNDVIQSLPNKPSSHRKATICVTDTHEEEKEEKSVSQKTTNSTESNKQGQEKGDNKEDNQNQVSRVSGDKSKSMSVSSSAAANLPVSSAPDSKVCPSREPTHHVGPCSSPSEDSAPRATSVGGHRPLHEGRTIRDEDQVWINTCADIPSHVGGRTRLGEVVPGEVQRINQTRSQVVRSLCRNANQDVRRVGWHRPSVVRESPDPVQADQDSTNDQDSTQNKREKQGSRSTQFQCDPGVPDERHVPGGGVRVLASGMGSRTSRTSTEPSECESRSRSAGFADPNAEFGERIATSHCTPPEPGHQDHCQPRTTIEGSEDNQWTALLAAGDPDSEGSESRETRSNREHLAYRKCLKEIQDRLDYICSQGLASKKTPTKLFEVFCGNNSRLTNQVLKMGHHACFALPQTDLMTSEGQLELFRMLEQLQPEHVWFSPECGPWSAWSNFNQSRSCQAWEIIQAQRIGNMSQLALGTILLRYQRERGRHFHWEQPQRSNMFRTPLLQELYCHTLASEFDMCALGDLRDPENGKLIKKGMTIMTTSEILQKNLHGHKCHRDHEHQPLEGNTKYQGETISRTKFSESYPRKFVRRVAQVLCKTRIPREKPIQSMPLVFTAEPEEPPVKKPRLSQQSAATPKAGREFEASPEKRRRIWGKGNQKVENNDQEKVWQEILTKISPQLPRVGKRVVENPEIIQQVAQLIQPKQLHSIVGGKGLNRTTAPLTKVAVGEAPFRMLVFRHRVTGKLEGVGRWEQWDNLAKRKIVRPGFPSSVAITVFAANPPDAPATDRVSQKSESTQERSTPLIPTPPEEVECDEPQKQSETTVFPGDNKSFHGPLFQQLPKEEQHMLMKIHKNAGHPGADKLAYLLRQQGFRPEVIAAVPDMQCDACEATKGPRISRPSSIHSPCDFNDNISMDGFTWTSKAGKLFHFYHVIDYSTNFHVAKYAPNRSTENAIMSIQQSWLSWAGCPNEMTIDAASELNAESFAMFTQQNNIKCTTISTEAHWQNGRAERHGAVLGTMLTKYDVENPILTGVDFEQALIHCTQAKNSLSIRKGYPPEILVLGKSTRVPGSICSDHQLPAHALADSETCHGLVFRQQLANRELARKAFHTADNDQALRRAILRRTRPSRNWYQPGEWVMVWTGGTSPGWRGPMKVVTQESQQTIWVTQHRKLYRPAPEHVRPVTSIESHSLDPQSAPMPAVLPRIENRPDPNNIEQNQIPTAAPGVIDQEDHNGALGSVGPSLSISDPEPMSEPPQSVASEESHKDGVQIPVPSETEDELVVGLYCQDEATPPVMTSNEAWKGEIIISQRDIEDWKKETTPLEMAFLVTAAKRQRSEVKLQTLDSDDRAQFEKAKQTEINNWLSTQTVKRIFRNQIPEDQILRCRWLLSWKPIDPSEQQTGQGSHKAKARLVVLGYLDPQLEEIPRDSPTMSKTSRMMVLQLIASEGWDLMSFDIRAAFLQGQPQSSRVLGLEPVPELRKSLCLKDEEICQLVKGAYGLVDAPFLWYKTLQAELLTLGFTASPFDPCVFLLWDPEKQRPQGILGIHVDDGLCGGNAQFHDVIAKLERKYPFGARKLGKFTFTGIDLHQNSDKSISLSQSSYVRSIKPISIPTDRRNQENEKVTESERQLLRGLIGSLQFASVNTRPDLASRLSNLQSQINVATVETLLQANRTLHEAKRHHEVSVVIQQIDPKQLRFLSFSDASFASKKIPLSQAGNIILATHQQIEKNVSSPVSPLSWGSKKIQKVVTSTLAAETMSLSSSLDQLSWIRLYWHWLYCPNDEWKHPSETLQKLPKAITSITPKYPETTEATSVVDCKSLFDLVTRTAPPNCQEFRTQLQAQAIKEQLGEGVGVRWVHSGAQLADSLTKIMENSFLRETLKLGHYKLNDEQEVLKERATARNRLKWLKETNQDNIEL